MNFKNVNLALLKIQFVLLSFFEILNKKYFKDAIQ